MAQSFLVFTLFVLGTLILGSFGDELDDLLLQDDTLRELEALTSLTGAGNPYSRSYTPLPWRRYDRGVNMLGGKAYIRELPDLVNLVFGLGGHIVGRAGWIVHDAFQSLFDGMATSQFKLRGDSHGGLFGPHPTTDDGILGIDDLLGGLLG